MFSRGSVRSTMRKVWLIPRLSGSEAHVTKPIELTLRSVGGLCRVSSDMPPRQGRCLHPRSACCETFAVWIFATNVEERSAVSPPARTEPLKKYDGGDMLRSFPGSGAPSRPRAFAVLAEKRARRSVRNPSCVHRTTKRSFGPAVRTSPTAVVPSPRQERKRPCAVTREIQRPSRKMSCKRSFFCIRGTTSV